MNTDDHAEVTTSTVNDVIDVALTHFSTHGFHDTKIEAVARDSGMSKRMIHYHFGDKKGLYNAVLQTAVARLLPPAEDLVVDSAVPVEGVRKIIEMLVSLHQSHPVEMKLAILESLHPEADLRNDRTLVDWSPLMLHLSKLLILGQDSGVFRPGISAHDLFVLISSLTTYPVSAAQVAENLVGVDFSSEENCQGLRRMLIDTVLAFLTSNIPNSGDSSYLHSRSLIAEENNSASYIYGEESTEDFL